MARGFTQPSKRVTQAFESAGVIREVLVKEGDVVKSGQVIMKQDDRMDRQELEVRRIDAESTVEVDSAQKEFDLRKVQYERKVGTDGGENIGFSKAEIEEALITMQLAELKVAEAKQKNTQAKAVYERQRVKTELMTLPSKIDGIVEKINVDAGEMADPQKPEGAISIVTNDPLWVEIPLLQTWQAARLKPGQELEVRYEIENKPGWHKAKVIYVAPVADARSGTQAVRLELPNPENRASGLDVQVKLPPELANDPTAGGVTGN
jgi:RND family efflux transporter MFP subunit